MQTSSRGGFSAWPGLLLLGMALSLVVGAVGAQDAKPPAAAAADDAAELAKKLANPIASLISVPIKYNWDTGIGTTDASRGTLIVQPVIPFSLNADTTLITRTIVPFIKAECA